MDGKEQFRRRMEWLEMLCGDCRINGGEMRAATLLAVKFVNSKSGLAYPGKTRMAKGLDMSVRHVFRCMSELCKLGWLQVHRKGGKTGRGDTTHYVLTHPDENGKIIPFQSINRADG